MDAEANLKSKYPYKIFLLILRYLPISLALTSVLNTVFSYFGIDLEMFSYIGGISIIPLIFIYLATYVFKFCVCQRLFLDYTVLSAAISTYDYHWGIPISNSCIVSLHLILFFVTCCIVMILHLKHKEHVIETYKQRT